MVITRSQSSQNRQVETENMDRSSDNESEASFPELLSRDQMVDLDSDDVLTRRQNSNSYSIDQRFNEINRQIGDLTIIVLTLTNQFASVNGEGNRLNPATTSTDGRSDIRELVTVYKKIAVKILREICGREMITFHAFPGSFYLASRSFRSAGSSL